MATRYSGSLTVRVTYDDNVPIGQGRRGGYRYSVSHGGKNLNSGIIKPPAARRNFGVDHALAYDEAARSALSFAADENSDVGDLADYDVESTGFVVSRKPPTKRNRTTSRRSKRNIGAAISYEVIAVTNVARGEKLYTLRTRSVGQGEHIRVTVIDGDPVGISRLPREQQTGIMQAVWSYQPRRASRKAKPNPNGTWKIVSSRLKRKTVRGVTLNTRTLTVRRVGSSALPLVLEADAYGTPTEFPTHLSGDDRAAILHAARHYRPAPHV